MFCNVCGRELVPGANFCPKCGAPISGDPAFKPGQSVNPMPVYIPPSTPKKKNSKVPVIIFVMIVFVALAGLGGYYGLKMYRVHRVDEYLDLGLKAIDEGKYDEAVADFRNAIEIDPMKTDAYLGMADAYTQSGDYKNAIRAIDDCIEATNDDSVVTEYEVIYVAYADSYLEENEWDKAIKVLNEGNDKIGDNALEDKILETEEYIEEEKERLEKEEEERIKKEKENWTADQCEDYRDELRKEYSEGYNIGQLMPDFIVYDKNGNPVDSSKFLGKTVYYNFFTTWCPYCYYELPDMKSINDDYDDAVVIMVDLQESPTEVNAYVRQYGITMDIYYLPYWQVGDLMIEGVPLSIVVDKYGMIHDIHNGMSDYNWMKQAVDKARNSDY